MMLIGTSLGRCLKDLINGEVSESDVVMIITRTQAPTLELFLAVIEQYYYGINGPAYDLTAKPLVEVQELGERLYSGGKIHQPRNFANVYGGYTHPGLSGDIWVEITPKNTNRNPIVVDAYEKYQVLDALTK